MAGIRVGGIAIAKRASGVCGTEEPGVLLRGVRAGGQARLWLYFREERI